MRTKKTACLFLLISVFASFIACKKKKEDTPAKKTPVVTTVAAVNLQGNSLDVQASISNPDNVDLQTRGVCWGTSTDPVQGTDNFVAEGSSAAGNFTLSVINKLEPNKTYYLRAFCVNNTTTIYGNSITVNTGYVANTAAPVEIVSKTAKLKGVVSQNGTVVNNVGFVYSTSPTPTINNSSTFTTVLGSGTYEATLNNLTPNTTYYVRAYTELSNPTRYFYGEEKQFKTTGYLGPAGGYVAYDKGELTDGWRYLEIRTTTLNYNIVSSPGAAWGNTGNFITGTFPQIGTGPANTNLIVAGVPGANCAAKLCDSYVQNGFSDWFLASADEMLLIANSLKAAGISLAGYAWTSTQATVDNAVGLEYNLPTSSYLLFSGYPKTFDNLNVYPVRRY